MRPRSRVSVGPCYASRDEEPVSDSFLLGFNRHLDCAWFYLNEDEIGDAVADFLEEQQGKVRREDLFICTKVWNHLHEPDEGGVSSFSPVALLASPPRPWSESPG